MSNPIFDQYGRNNGNMNSMFQQFDQFRQMFRGDPKQQVQMLLNSGRVTQEQYNRAVEMANQMMRMLK